MNNTYYQSYRLFENVNNYNLYNIQYNYNYSYNYNDTI